MYLRRSIRVLLLASANEEEERLARVCARQASQGRWRSFNSNNQLLLVEYTVVCSRNANLHLIDWLAGSRGVVQCALQRGFARRQATVVVDGLIPFSLRIDEN